jgi:hypothetical protein
LDLKRFERIAAVAIRATEFPAARFSKNELHRFVARRADGRRGFFGK